MVTTAKSCRMGAQIRQWKLRRLIAASRYMTVQLLSEQLEVAPKTVRRDLMALEAAGFPLNIGGLPEYNHVRLEPDWFLKSEPRQYVPIRELERRQA